MEINSVKKIFLLTFFCIFFATHSFASSLYSIVVNVDETSTNVATAKKQALSKAIRNGLNDVILRISTEETINEISKLNDNQIQHFISGLQVLLEKSSDIRYIAELKIDINQDVLQNFIKENNLPIIISQTETALIIPVLEAPDGTLDIWGNNNTWREAFINRKNLQTGFLKFYNIEKNLGNITTVNANTIYNMTEGSFLEISSFNKVDNIYVLKYSPKDNKVYIKSFPDKTELEVDIDTETPSLMIDKILPLIKSNKKQSTPQNNIQSPSNLNIIYTYPSLNKWIELKKLLESDPMVENLKIISLANKKVHFTFTYHGVFERLQTSLGLNGYVINNNGGYYAIN